jgi:hypothetical protein
MSQQPTFLYDKTFIYHLNSANRISGTNSDFNVKVDLTGTGFSITNFDSVCLLSASIPKSYYAIQDGMNTFIFGENATTGYVEYTITIPPGTYSANNFATTVSNLINDNTEFTYTITVDLNKAKFTFTSSNPIKTYVVKPGEFLYNRFGLEKNSTNNSSGGFIFSDNVIDMSPESDLFIRSDIISGGADANEDIFYDIQASNVPPFGRIQTIDSDPQQHSRVLNNTQDTYRFFITDEFGNAINLNGLNWTATILFFKKSSIPQKIKDFISYIVEMF